MESNNSREWALNILKNSPGVKIKHKLFNSSKLEFIYSKEDGNVYDSNGKLFEDWGLGKYPYAYTGMRMRIGCQDGWSLA